MQNDTQRDMYKNKFPIESKLKADITQISIFVNVMSNEIEINFFKNLEFQLKLNVHMWKTETWIAFDAHHWYAYKYNASQHMRSRLQLFVNTGNAMKKVWNMLSKPWQYYDQHMERFGVLAAFSCRNITSQYNRVFVYSKTKFWCSLLQSVTYYLIETQSEVKIWVRERLKLIKKR